MPYNSHEKKLLLVFWINKDSFKFSFKNRSEYLSEATVNKRTNLVIFCCNRKICFMKNMNYYELLLTVEVEAAEKDIQLPENAVYMNDCIR